MFDLTKFTATRKVKFQQLARDRKEDFEALREKARRTASIYMGHISWKRGSNSKFVKYSN